jgi:hypothetical protein
MIALQHVDEVVGRQVPLPCLNCRAKVYLPAAPAVSTLSPKQHLLAALVVAEYGSDGDDLEVTGVHLPPRNEIRLHLREPTLPGDLVLFAAAHVVAHGAD